MAPTKTATLNLRIDPALKDALKTAAIREHRSVANMVEILVRRHCESENIRILEQQALFEDPEDE